MRNNSNTAQSGLQGGLSACGRSLSRIAFTLATALCLASTGSAADSYTVSGTTILKNGAPWVGGGVSAFDQWAGGGGADKSGKSIKVVREPIANFSACPIASTDPDVGFSGGVLHSLQGVVDHNRAQGMVTILCPFGWDASTTVFVGLTPGQTPFWNSFKTRMARLAQVFANQPDVWIEAWNEPYPWDDAGFTEQQWVSDMNDIYNTIRGAGNNNIVLIPGQANDGGWSGHTVLVNKGASFLTGKANVVATLHAYAYWTDWNGTAVNQADTTARVNAVRNAGWALIMGECGPAGDANVGNAAFDGCKPFLDNMVNLHVPTLAWSWDSGDGLALVSGGANTYWGNVFFPYLPQLVPAPSASPAGNNIARGRAVTVSSSESASYGGGNVVDGNLTTRWSSLFSDPQWIQIDLGATYNISRVKLAWEAAYAKSYKVQVSNNGSAWTDIYSTTTGAGGTVDLTGLSGSGRYIRMYGTTRGTPYGYSLYEFEVYSSSVPLANGSYNLTPGCATGSRLDANASGTTNGTPVTLWSANGAQNQQWLFTHMGSGWYKIQPAYATTLALDVNGAVSANGTKVQLWQDNGSTAQRWSLTAVPGGYTLTPQCATGSRLDVNAGASADGTKVQIWQPNGTTAQTWNIR